jgi:hypothetical protein
MGLPLGRKRAQGCPLVATGHGTLLKMPSRSTSLYDMAISTGKSHISGINLCHLGAELSILRGRKCIRGVNYPLK